MREIFVFCCFANLTFACGYMYTIFFAVFVSVNLHINITWLVVFCRLIQLHIRAAAAAAAAVKYLLFSLEILKNTARR